MFLERTIIVSEYVGRPLTEQPFHCYDDILKIFYQIACGLKQIQSLDFTVQTLEPKNILVDELGNVKLFNYGMFYQTNRGEYVTFPIGLVCSIFRMFHTKQNYFSFFPFNFFLFSQQHSLYVTRTNAWIER